MPSDLPLSVWPTAQASPRRQRAGRYVGLSRTHPARMLPAIARRAIEAYSIPGSLIVDVMAGAGTTLVEAVHLGRDAIGIEYEPPFVALAEANLAYATSQGATGHGEVVQGDARYAASLIDPAARGLVALVLTSPPYGPSLHGNVHAVPGGGVKKRDHRYSADPANLGNVSVAALLDAMRAVFRECRALLAPGGLVVMTARPRWRDGRFVDFPGALGRAGEEAGLRLYERNVALLAGLRDDHLVPRVSFFALDQVRRARERGIPRLAQGHEDVLVWKAAAR
jgi:modification methylase